MLLKPLLQHDAFLADVELARSQRDTLHLWWLGQSGYLIQWNGKHLLLDPYLSDSLTRKYADTPKPHVRMTELVVEPSRLDFIDAVTSSHNHTDHLDGETLIPLLEVNPLLPVIVPEANRHFAADRLQQPPERLAGITCSNPIVEGGFTFTAIPAAHETLDRDENGHYKCIGLVIEIGPWTLYHSGDTMWYGGIVEEITQARGLDKKVDIAMLPINGRDPKRGVAGNLNGLESADLAQQIGAGIVFPCHYDMFEFNTVPPEQFVTAAEAVGQPYRVLQNGERWSTQM